MKSRTAYDTGKPLVEMSEASKCTDIQAESFGPREGMKESGSVVTTITCPPATLTTALSRPNRGPTRTSLL